MKQFRHRGSILIFTLWILVCLSLIALGFGRRARLEVRAAAYEMDSMTARLLARSAVELGVAALREDAVMSPDFDALTEPWAKEKEVPIGDIMGAAADGLGEEVLVTYSIVDEGRKLNINRATEDMLRSFKLLPRVIAGEIAMRRHGEDTGSKSDDYSFSVPEELLEFKGLEAEDWMEENEDMQVRLCDTITVYGSGKININTAPPELIAVIPDLSQGAADDIVDYRRGPDGVDGTGDDNPFRLIEDLANVPGLRDVKSPAFTITGKARLRDGRVAATVQAVVRQSVYTTRREAWRER